MTLFDDTPERALAWHEAGQGAVLATVVQTWGSAPRRVGSQLAVRGDGEMAGSVSGGCVEGAVVTEALEALQDGKTRMLEYGVSDEDAFAVGLACGGTIRVLVEPVGAAMPAEMLSALVAARAARRPVAYLVNPGTGARSLEDSGHEARFRMDRSGMEEDNATFVTIFNPPLRLFIVGAVHIAQALVPMARIAGFDPLVIDPRDSFASPQRFPDTVLHSDWPDEVLAEVGLDTRAALVLLTHDPKIDDPGLELALRSPAFYIGALGSRRTHAGRRDRLLARGFSEEDIARIHGPVGLDIGAAGPAEIAVSILAQMVDVLRNAR
ncbi:XdhC family protein [Pseudooceanicola algae]|uniref:Molybdenum cofactor insertion chaperone PaoD n=1 Tax=Pseudooceanicola algae TaxID=1537215 RepID=A0A418SF07_9RHOB|nr:XdhC family protein [Pseudooceanicola algae]QPM89324.1 Molybdenum cofactor insertion chaperone PaoD [Pseudooceanicola algae]